MSKVALNILSISYAKKALEEGSRERERMKLYATAVDELHVVVFTKKSEGFASHQTDENLYLYATNSHTNFGKLVTAIKLGRQIIKNKPNKKWLVSSQDPFETSLVGNLVASGNQAAHQVQIHGDVFNPLSRGWSPLNILRVWFARHIVKKASGIRVVSERIKKSLLDLGVAPNKISVLPIQADLRKFLNIGKNRIYDKHLGETTFLYVGRFSTEKNIQLIVEAFSHISKDFPQIKLFLSGEGKQIKSTFKKILDLGLEDRILLQPWADDIASVMGKHDVLCLSSNHEGWGMVLVEAAAAGMPVVSTDVGCVGELIKDHQHGLVVPVDDLLGFSRAMHQYASNLELLKKHGQAGHKLAQDFILSEEEYLQKMVECWSSCLI